MSHDHSHAHAPAPEAMNGAFLAGILLNSAFLLVEVVYGVRSHSLSLVADGAHNFGDVLSLGLAWLATWLMTRRATTRRTYGYRRAGILAALANAMLLLAATGGILWESLQRFWHPEPAQGTTMIVVAGLGTLINLGSALFFLRGRHADLNVRGAFLHLMGDAAVSLGVVAGGIGILWTGWSWLDPLLGLVVGILVMIQSWPLFRSALDLSLDAVPAHVDLDKVRMRILAAPGVLDLHHLHVWALSTTSTALSVHLVVAAGTDGETLTHALAHALDHDFRIDHATLQIETPAGAGCLLQASPHVHALS